MDVRECQVVDEGWSGTAMPFDGRIPSASPGPASAARLAGSRWGSAGDCRTPRPVRSPRRTKGVASSRRRGRSVAATEGAWAVATSVASAVRGYLGGGVDLPDPHNHRRVVGWHCSLLCRWESKAIIAIAMLDYMTRIARTVSV